MTNKLTWQNLTQFKNSIWIHPKISGSKTWIYDPKSKIARTLKLENFQILPIWVWVDPTVNNSNFEFGAEVDCTLLGWNWASFCQKWPKLRNEKQRMWAMCLSQQARNTASSHLIFSSSPSPLSLSSISFSDTDQRRHIYHLWGGSSIDG